MRAVASVEVDVVALDGPACVSGVMASEAMVSVMAILIFRSVSDVRVCSRVRAMCRRSGRPELRSLGEVVGAVANLLCGDRAQPPSLEAALQHRGWGEERGPGTVGGRFSRALLRALAMSR